jgi:hypothetical protein
MPKDVLFIAFTCYTTRPASIVTMKDDSNLAWNQYTYTYTATKVEPIVVFRMYMENNIYILLDDTSVVATADPSVQLLDNPDFQNSSSSPTGWNLWCQSGCDTGSTGVITGSNCRTSRCYKGQCTKGGNPNSIIAEYLVQTFSATIGQTYTLSFWFRRIGSGGNPGDATFTVGII